MNRKKLQWGILGCAGIAKGAVIPGVRGSELNEVAAIASRDGEKAKQTAEELQIPKAYGSYEAMLADDSIDVIYIPLPNHLHREWTIRAAEAGKHILCEKPLALTAQEAAEMVEACVQAGVHLAEAFMYRHHPRYAMMKDIIASGEIGEIRAIRSAFTFNNAAVEQNIRFHKQWGGGALYDVGCYPISAARLLLEQEPEAVTVQALFSPKHGEVDMMASGLLEFPNAVSLTFDCGMWAFNRNVLEVVGTSGMVEVPSAFVSPTPGSADFYVQTKGERRLVEVPHINAYSAQADQLARAIYGEEPLRFAAEDAICNMKILEACLRSGEERTRVELL